MVDIRIDVTQETVLEAVVDQLRTQLGLNRRTCWETLEPLAPKIPKSGEFFVTVSPGPGQFVEGEQQVGNITEQWTITVTAYSRIKLDSTDHDEKLLRDARRGLLQAKRKILQSLVGQDIQDPDRDVFLRQLLYAISCSRPEHDSSKHIAWISLEFGVDFDWDLTGDII